jgi:hypothetical protein
MAPKGRQMTSLCSESSGNGTAKVCSREGSDHQARPGVKFLLDVLEAFCLPWVTSIMWGSLLPSAFGSHIAMETIVNQLS